MKLLFLTAIALQLTTATLSMAAPAGYPEGYIEGSEALSIYESIQGPATPTYDENGQISGYSKTGDGFYCWKEARFSEYVYCANASK